MCHTHVITNHEYGKEHSESNTAQYHVNATVVSNFTIATRKWVKLCKQEDLSHTQKT